MAKGAVPHVVEARVDKLGVLDYVCADEVARAADDPAPAVGDKGVAFVVRKRPWRARVLATSAGVMGDGFWRSGAMRVEKAPPAVPTWAPSKQGRSWAR